MKRRSAVAAALLLAVSAGAHGQVAPPSSPPTGEYPPLALYQAASMPRLERGYLASLSHPVDGVVESALKEVARLKIAQQCCTSSKIEEKLRELVVSGATPSIRYKAALTVMLFDSPETFAALSNREFKTADELYVAIARTMEFALLTPQE